MMDRAYERWIFAGTGNEPRLRRPSDAFLLTLSAIGFVITVLIADERFETEGRYAFDFGDLLRSAAWLFEIVYAAAIGLAAAIAIAALVTKRRALLRDIASAFGLAFAVGVTTDAIVDVAPPFPAVQLACVLAIVIVARPDLALPMRHLTTAAVVLAVPGAVVLERALFSSAFGAVSAGIAAGAAVRLLFGTSAGLVERNRMRELLAEFGMDFEALDLDDRQQPGSARYLGRVDGRPLAVRLYGRDALDTRYVSRLWRFMWYRDAGPQLAFSRLHLVEHESLMLMLAARADVPVPEVVCSGVADSGDAVLVTTVPRGDILDDSPEANALTDATLAHLWQALARLRARGIAHGQLDARALAFDDGAVTLLDFSAARTNAEPATMATDVAELLVTTALLVGPERAVDVAIAELGAEVVIEALPYVQRAALNPWLRSRSRQGGFDFDDLRERAAAAAGAELPETVPIRRLNVRDVVFMGLIAVAAYLIITGLLDIGIENIVDALSEAEIGWVLLGLVVSSLTLFTNAFAMQGAVGRPIPYGPTVLLQAAIKFINLTVPTMAGRIAINIRYLQRLGVPIAIAVTQGAIDGLAGTVVQAVLFLSVLPFVDFNLPNSERQDNLVVLVGLLAAGAVLAILAVVVIPALRRKVAPFLRTAWENVADVVRSPRRLGHLFAGNAGSELLFALTLGACCRAYGVELPLTELLFVNIAVTMFVGIMPVPGGIGVAEAGLTAGLVAFGVPEPVAFAAALTHRLVTYYVPPAWGWIALRWLGQRDYV